MSPKRKRMPLRAFLGKVASERAELCSQETLAGHFWHCVSHWNGSWKFRALFKGLVLHTLVSTSSLSLTACSMHRNPCFVCRLTIPGQNQYQPRTALIIPRMSLYWALSDQKMCYAWLNISSRLLNHSISINYWALKVFSYADFTVSLVQWKYCYWFKMEKKLFPGEVSNPIDQAVRHRINRTFFWRNEHASVESYLLR